MGKPRTQKSGVLDGGIVLPDEQMGLDLEAFDNVVRGKGATLVHHRALRCPVGLQDPADTRRTHEDHSGCSNGFVYLPIGRLKATLTSNVTQQHKEEMGWYDGSTVLATFPRFYDSDPTKRVLVRPYDRFYLEQVDILTGTWDLTKRRRDGSPDRLEFPAVQVEHLLDSENNQYYQNVDFDLVAGDIVWRATRGPLDGQVYSVWYQYKPYWYVDRLEHEIRLFPTHDFVSPDEVRMERLGFGAVLQREYVHRTQSPDDLATRDTSRQKLPPDQEDDTQMV